MRQQAELVDHRIARQKLEKSVYVKEQEIAELLERVKTYQQQKYDEKRQADIAKRERNYLSESMKELKTMINKAVEL